MADFFPTYFVADMNLPTDYHYSINFLLDLLTWDFVYTDITYDTPKFDVKDIKFLLRDRYRPEIIVDFPALESLSIHAI